MYSDNVKFRVFSNRKAKKSNIKRSVTKHLNLIRREDIAQRELYFWIRVSKLTNYVGHDLISGSRNKADP
jgi:hypothetical protein